MTEDRAEICLLADGKHGLEPDSWRLEGGAMQVGCREVEVRNFGTSQKAAGGKAGIEVQPLAPTLESGVKANYPACLH